MNVGKILSFAKRYVLGLKLGISQSLSEARIVPPYFKTMRNVVDPIKLVVQAGSDREKFLLEIEDDLKSVAGWIAEISDDFSSVFTVSNVTIGMRELLKNLHEGIYSVTKPNLTLLNDILLKFVSSKLPTYFSEKR